ncbi:MAG: DUF1801 domain-containing protein [Chloroflexi bacterium]|nr:DUF1801 domain-containing protein [Chloroflexota bacterium]
MAELPEGQRQVVTAVRDLIRRNLPDGYAESMNWGMISYEIPLADYPKTYNKQPLTYISLAAQKNHYALYLMGLYQDQLQTEWLKEAYEQMGKKLDMGKSCVRFRKLEDLPLDLIAQVVASMPPADFIAQYEMSRGL